MEKDYKNIDIKNKKASFDYEFLEQFTAGIKLVGTEIKAIRLGKANVSDAFCYFEKGELYVKGMNVSEYDWGSYSNHEPRRDRKLLLNKKELFNCSSDQVSFVLAVLCNDSMTQSLYSG